MLQLENNLRKQRNVYSISGSFTRGRLNNNNSYREFGQGRGQGQERGHYKTNQGDQNSKKIITSFVEGQMEEETVKDSPIQSVSSQHLLSRMVGHPNESKIFMNGGKTRALIDTGSMVTCMSENFY